MSEAMHPMHRGNAKARVAVRTLPAYFTVMQQGCCINHPFVKRTTPMAAIDTTTRAPIGTISTPRFFSIFQAVRDWNDARVTRGALNRLSDRELDDIGLTRADIARI